MRKLSSGLVFTLSLFAARFSLCEEHPLDTFVRREPTATYYSEGANAGDINGDERPELNEQPGLLTREFIYDTAPFPECHASTIVETQGGLVAAWFGGTREQEEDVGIWLSRF